MKNATAYQFDGDFDFIPVRSHIVYGAVPSRPTYSDFALAVSVAQGSEDIAAHWRVEAIRERRLRPACEINETTLRAINCRAAARLYVVLREAM